MKFLILTIQLFIFLPLNGQTKDSIYFYSFLGQNDLTPTEGGISYKDVAKRRVSAITEELFFLEGVKHE